VFRWGDCSCARRAAGGYGARWQDGAGVGSRGGWKGTSLMRDTRREGPKTPRPTPAIPSAPRRLALILAGVAAAVWSVAGLALALTLLVLGILVLALSAPLRLVLAPLVLACRCGTDWRWGWLCWPAWLLAPGSWLRWYWFRWPWLAQGYPRDRLCYKRHD